MAQTTRFGLQLLYEAQSQKSVVVDEDLINLDALLYLNVVDAAHTAPPVTAPADQACYLIASPSTGAWAGLAGQIAVYQSTNGSWLYIAPVAGMLALNSATQAMLVYTGAAWTVLATVVTGTSLGILSLISTAAANNLAALGTDLNSTAAAALAANLGNLTPTASNIIVGTGTAWASETPMQGIGPIAAMMALIYGG
jgi:Protein of unknown function (DUF2793)